MKTRTLSSGVVVRPYETADAMAILAAVDTTRVRLAQWMPWVPFATTVEDFEDYIRLALRQGREGTGLHRGLWESSQLVGAIGAAIGPLNFDEADIGYWLVESHEGAGVASEAVRDLIEWLFVEREMYRITIRAATGNSRSRAVAERLGFTFEATLRRSLLLQGDHKDAALYSLLADEWEH